MTAMSERLIPKERLSAYERWEAVSFDEPLRPEPIVEPVAPPVKLPTADELEAIQQQAYQEGYEAGIAEARDENRRIAGLGVAFQAALATLEGDVAQSLLDLSIDLARQILREAITVKPELILPVVRESLERAVESNQTTVIKLNPADVDLVKHRLSEDIAAFGWRVAGDEGIEAGGVRIESASCDVDSTLEQRWANVMSTLGRTDAWLA